MSTTLTPRTETVVLFQGDDLERIEELAAAVTSAVNQSGPATLAEGDPVQDAARAHDEFVTEAEGRAVKIKVKPLRRSQWRSLVDLHPARTVKVTEKGDDGNEHESETPHEDDAPVGFNIETMADDLVPASIAEGQFDTPADRDEFLDSLSDPDYSKIYGAAVRLNVMGGRLPKADLSSRLARITGETSTSPEG